MTSNETKEQLDCYNNPNWNDEALKRCKKKGRYFTCLLCCNESVCDMLYKADTGETMSDTYNKSLQDQLRTAWERVTSRPGRFF